MYRDDSFCMFGEIMKKIQYGSLLLVILFIVGCDQPQKEFSSSSYKHRTNPSFGEMKKEIPSHPFVDSAREQIGIVTKYDTGYYQGGYPPEDRGACTDVIEQSLRENGYHLKQKIDEDMKTYPERYSHVSDPNINFRRVRNVKVFLDHSAESLSTCVTLECFEEGIWQAGDIVTFDQIPGSLWHIAFISNKTTKEGIPLLLHNYGIGVVEDNKLLSWPAPITGHYRINIKEE